MHLRRGQFNGAAEDLLRERYKTDQYTFRTRYERICENLEAAFGSDELYYGFYESMFTNEEIIRISNFIGLPPDCSYRNVKINAAHGKKTLSDDLAADIKGFYAETYKYCKEKFQHADKFWR